MVRLPDRLPMLYNLNEDLAEQHNLARKYPEKVESMLKRLGDWDVSCPQVLFLEGDPWRRRQLDLYDRPYSLNQPLKP